jgi:phosphoribosylformylglycinamidine (FGAM) synthase-like enzyme
VKADLPLKALSGEAPEYDRPWVAPPPPAAARRDRREMAPLEALLR